MISVASLSAAAKKHPSVAKLASELRLQHAILRWRRLQMSGARAATSGEVARLVVLSPDPWALVGSKGDEAMLIACIARFRARVPALTVGVLTASPDAERAAQRLGLEALPVWSEPWDPTAVIAAVERFRPDALIAFGADVMDGYYDPMTSFRIAALSDLAARRGIRSAILGFSFNAQPHPALASVFKRTTPALRVRVRDPQSLARFSAFAGRTANLVADAAFMLEPDHSGAQVAEVTRWAEQRRSAGDHVIAFNMHPLLLRRATDAQLDALVASACTALRVVLSRQQISLLLLPHDYRGREGDDRCLAPIAEKLGSELGARIYHPSKPLSAAQLKAIAGQMDGVVTGRMHLAIAALGCGVPVLALTYQDKFQGLLEHFALPESLLLAPQEILVPQRLADAIESFVSKLDSLREVVKVALPRVLRRSADNLVDLIPG